MKSKLEDFRYDMDACIRCSLCKWIDAYYMRGIDYAYSCPSHVRYLFDAYSAQGRVNIASALLDGRLKSTEKLQEIIYACTLCGSCDVQCKRIFDYEILNILEELRVKAVELGIGPPPAHKRIAENVKRVKNVYGEMHEKRFAWLPEEITPAKKADILLFVGCEQAYRSPEVAVALVKLLKALGIDFMILGGSEWCCGSPLFRTGQVAAGNEVMQQNIAAIENSGASKVLTACAGCYYALKVGYEKWSGKRMKYKTLHISELLSDLLKKGDLKFTKEVKMKATYHDPCLLGRMSEPWVFWEGKRTKFGKREPSPSNYRRGTYGVYEQPRDVLKSIPGLDLIEMIRIKENAWCCGAGGGVKAAFNNFATWTATERIKEAQSVGAQAIVTSCTFCGRNFKDAVNKMGIKMDIYDLVEVALMGVGGG